MQKIYVYIFAVYFASLGLSPLWGVHVHHNHEHALTDSHDVKQAVLNPQTVIASTSLSKKKTCTRSCDDCTIESLLGHLLENKTFLRKSSLTLKAYFIHKIFTYQRSAIDQLLSQLIILKFSKAIPTPLSNVGFFKSSAPRGPPFV